MFVGGAVVAGVAASALASARSAAVGWPVASPDWVLPAFGLAVAFMGSNLCLQFGAARLAGTTTALVMTSEVLFASLTAVAWGGATLHASVVAGGVMILLAALSSAWGRAGAGP
jgi:drug/metabolite transporter (DMT)-like permease